MCPIVSVSTVVISRKILKLDGDCIDKEDSILPGHSLVVSGTHTPHCGLESGYLCSLRSSYLECSLYGKMAWPDFPCTMKDVLFQLPTFLLECCYRNK